MKTRNILVYLALGALTMTIFSADQAADARNAIRLDGQLKILQASRSVPDRLSYQGYLMNVSDSSAVTTTLEMTFQLFDFETKGAQLWSETHSAVEVNNGLFQVLLGSMTPFPDGLFDGSTLWLQTEVGSEILTPRKPLVSVAYSQRAEDADHAAAAASAADADHLEGYTVADLDGRWANEEDLDHLDAADGDPSDAVYVDDEGQVGIGTSSPLTELDVNGSVNAATYYGDGSNLTGITALPDADWTVSGDTIYHQTGPVGIGTDSPAYILDVAGPVSATTFYGDGSNLTGISGTTDNDWTISGDDIYHETGNVGIGTATPTAPLAIGVVSGPDLQFTGSGYNTDIFAASEFKIGTSGSNNLHLMTDNNYRLTVTSGGGRVGIGTTLPYEKLHIHEDAKGSCYSQFTNAATGSGPTDGLIVGINTDGSAFIHNRETLANLHLGTSNSTRLFIHNTGKVGIGTISPSARLDVRDATADASVNVHGQDDGKSSYDLMEGAAYLSYDEAEAEVRLWNAVTGGNAGYLSFGTNNAERMRISKEGDVGIGTISSYAKLQVYNSSGLTAVSGEDSSSGNFGYVGHTGYGIYGSSNDGVAVGGFSTEGTGVIGSSDYGLGVYGDSEDSVGVYGYSISDYGVYGYSHALQAVYGKHLNGNYGYLGGLTYGAYGYSSSGYGARGNSTSGYGVWGSSTSGIGVYGNSSYRAVYGNSSSGHAGYFDGNVHIDGTLTGGKGATVIDHPLDPENRLLRQNFVESPENLWIYRGTAQLDGAGEAVVQMPDYFAVLTREDEATVHLTPVGKPFLAGYQWQFDGVSFRVYGQPSGEVSWVVYADRDDPVIHELAQPTVEEKGPDNKLCDRGKLLYPEAYGYPKSAGANYEEMEKMRRLAEE